MDAEDRLLIEPVVGRRAMRRFIATPRALYRDDPCWVAPLDLERREHFSPKNPVFEHLEWAAWIALRKGRVVGRISAQVDHLYQELHDTDTGFFGCIEIEDKRETFAALLAEAEAWAAKRGLRRLLGPFNLNINQESGLLVDGFDSPPNMMMGHARPYFGARLEEQGFAGVQDLLAYRVDPDIEPTRAMRALLRMTKQNVTVRPLNRKALESELEILRDIFNDAWSGNWGFVPFTAREIHEVGKGMLLLADSNWIKIAEVDGEPAAMIVGLPNLNEAIRDLDGRLFPLGWAKLLWRLKVRLPKTARILLMGVRKQYHNTRLGPALAFRVIDAERATMVEKGVSEVEMSWILEQNSGMRNIIESIGGEAYKRYRMYEKQIAVGD